MDLSDGSKGGFVVSCLSCFGGGVILTTALTHMLPEVNLFLQYNIQQGQLIDRVRVNSQSFLKILKMEFQGWPLAEIWVLCGFFMVYFVEEVGKIEQNRSKSPGAQSTKDPVQVTHILMRRCNATSKHEKPEKGVVEGNMMLESGHGHSHALPQAGTGDSGFEVRSFV